MRFNQKHHHFLLLVLCQMFLFALIVADNSTSNQFDQSNETTVEMIDSTLLLTSSPSINVGNIDVDYMETLPMDDDDDDTETTTPTVDKIQTSTFIDNFSSLSMVVETTLTDSNTTTIHREIESTTGSIDSHNQMNETSVFINESTTATVAAVEESTTNRSMTCESSPYGCCPDGLTERTGPNDEGCHDDMNGTISNSTIQTISITESDLTSTIETIHVTNTSEILLLESSTVNINDISNDSSTFTSFEVDSSSSSTVEIFESSSETTTQVQMTTLPPSKSCIDSEFECCPNGETAARGPQFEGCNSTAQQEKAVTGTKISLETVCELDKDAGSCSKYVNMWAFDRQQGKCTRFWYGSCEGNGNRFETEEQCQETCINPRGIEGCLLPNIKGPCQAASNRWYYDRNEKECRQFIYGGCNGNVNNYETIEKCQLACVRQTVDRCTQPMEIGPCKGEFIRFYYDLSTSQCRSFVYGGCKKNENHFLTMDQCSKICIEPRQRDICLQPKIVGTCQERQSSWYFDLIDRECKMFHYSGCKGNHNRFASKEECQLSCSSFAKVAAAAATNETPELCQLPMVRGSCDQQISRWHFNSRDQYCHSFQYTGCHGNANAFETEQDCRRVCRAKEKDICTFEKDPGSCDQYKIMWYHDPRSGQCKNFYYGSCGGNANRFPTEQECQLRCLLKLGNSTCFQQVDQGHPCPSNGSTKNATKSEPVLKFFYDQELRKCSSFLYHGCDGNDNRFDEENQCTQNCLSNENDSNNPIFSPTADQGCGSNMIRCNIQCRFGFERDANGCEICRCFEPCQRQQCPAGYECVIIPEQVQCVQAPCPVPRVECRPVNLEQMPNIDGGIKPLIENSITNIFAQFDANITLPCTLRQGYPIPVIYWYKERQQLQVHEVMNGGIIVRRIERLPDQSLLIRKVTLEDQGLYTCRAINEHGQDIKDVQLEIFDPIKMDIYPINRIYQLGFTAKLQCRATGFPTPRVTWMRNNVPLVNTTRLILQTDGSMIIHPYMREDAGPYVCNATNKKESMTQVAYLEVKETRLEPICEDQPTFANCELVLRHNFCDVYFDYCCHTCSQQHTQSTSAENLIRSSRQTLRHSVRRHLHDRK